MYRVAPMPGIWSFSKKDANLLHWDELPCCIEDFLLQKKKAYLNRTILETVRTQVDGSPLIKRILLEMKDLKRSIDSQSKVMITSKNKKHKTTMDNQAQPLVDRSAAAGPVVGEEEEGDVLELTNGFVKILNSGASLPSLSIRSACVLCSGTNSRYDYDLVYKYASESMWMGRDCPVRGHERIQELPIPSKTHVGHNAEFIGVALSTNISCVMS
eukprot:scaffold60933_cov55-Attheya_sp.AAC.4